MSALDERRVRDIVREELDRAFTDAIGRLPSREALGITDATPISAKLYDDLKLSVLAVDVRRVDKLRHARDLAFQIDHRRQQPSQRSAETFDNPLGCEMRFIDRALRDRGVVGDVAEIDVFVVVRHFVNLLTFARVGARHVARAFLAARGSLQRRATLRQARVTGLSEGSTSEAVSS